MIEKSIINIFCKDRDLYSKYYKHINLDYVKTNYTNLYKMFLVLSKYYDKNKETNSLTKEELELSYNSNYLIAEDKRQEISSLVEDIYNSNAPDETVIDLLKAHKKRSIAGDLAKVALDVEDGSANPDDLMKLYTEYESEDDIDEEDSTEVDMNLETLYETQVKEQGLRWRLDFLNKSLGSLRKGDFGFIFARPETGKTTFLASEVSNMVQQTTGEVLWFNNEEQGSKVAIRCFQATLGLKHSELFNNIPDNQEKYNALTGNRIKILDFEDSSRASKIEDVLRNSNPSLIIFDQIDKIKGFKADRNDLELKAIYQWAREIAKKYAPVIAVSQAGGTGEGKLWLTMEDVDGSKTGKQGEADFILGIGKEQDNTSRVRFLNISKNKLVGDLDTKEELRHGNSQVLIQPEIARYSDL